MQKDWNTNLLPEDVALNQKLDQAVELERLFLTAIHQPCHLKFEQNKVIIAFLGICPTCPLPGISYSKQKDDADWQIAVCPIGDAFTSAYTKLINLTKSLNSFELNENRLDAVYQIVSDIRLLQVAMQSLDNAIETPSDLTDKLSYFCESGMKPFYGDRMIQDNTYQVLRRFTNSDAPDHGAFLSYLHNQVNFEYKCENLYQLCGAILDYLCHHTIDNKYSTKSHKYSLRRCPRCGRYFTTEDRKIIYCKPDDEDKSKKSCAALQEIDRKKKLARVPQSDAAQLAEKIRRRLYSYKAALKISRVDHTGDPESKRRADLYTLFVQQRQEHSKSPHYKEWVKECVAQLPKSRDESYDRFYEWLLERS